MTMKSGSKFKEKFTCGFKYDIRNLEKFNPTTQKPENFTSICSFCPKYIRFELKKNTEELSSTTLNSFEF